MRLWVIAFAVLTVAPAYADSRFRVGKLTHNSAPFGKGQCDVRLKVDNQVEVTVRRDMVMLHTLAGQDSKNDGSECSSGLPDHDLRGFTFQVIERRDEIQLVEQPSRANDFAVVVKIHDSAGGFGRYIFRLNWDTVESGPEAHRNVKDPLPPPHGPEGFSWNNAVSFRGHGQGDSRLEDVSQHLTDVTVDIDRGGKVIVSFFLERQNRKEKPKQLVFTGMVMGREQGRLKADMTTDDHRLHGPMFLSVDDRQQVNSIAMDATDGQDHLHLNWDRK